MAKITNTGKTPRGLPLINRRHIEIHPGETKDFPDADYAAIKDRKDISHLVSTGILKVEGSAPAVALSGDMKPDGQITLNTKTFDVADAPAPAPAAAPATKKKAAAQ